MDLNSQLIVDLAIMLGAAFACCMALTPLVRGVAKSWGLVDRPDGRRKIHKTPIPVAGGVVVYLASSLVLGAALVQIPAWREALVNQRTIYAYLFLACSVIALVGVIDDYRGMRGRHKLVGQLIAVGIVIAGGVQVRSINIFGYALEFGTFWSVLITGFWLLGAINSLNLIDGMDGLLGSVGLIVCLTIGAMAFLNGQFAAACVAVTLAGALLGFLWYNFPPATIYLGDAGSMLIGLVIGTLAIRASLKGPVTVAMAAPVALMIVPIFDTSAALVRRILTGRSIYTTDRGHLHHILMRNGLSNQKVLLIVGLLTTLAGLGAIVSQWQKNELFAVASAAAIVAFLVVFKMFGYAEFLLIKEKVLAMVANVRHGNDDGRVHQIKVHLQGSADWNDLWRDLTRSAEDLRLKSLCFDVNAPVIHEGYHARWDRTQKDHGETSGFWRVEIPLSVNAQVVGRLEVIGLRDENSAWQKLAALAKIVEDIELVIATMIAAQDLSALASPPAAPLPPAKGLRLERT